MLTLAHGLTIVVDMQLNIESFTPSCALVGAPPVSTSLEGAVRQIADALGLNHSALWTEQSAPSMWAVYAPDGSVSSLVGTVTAGAF